MSAFQVGDTVTVAGRPSIYRIVTVQPVGKGLVARLASTPSSWRCWADLAELTAVAS